MAEETGISWANATFNPWMGCTKVSPACKNCYAERDMDLRYGKVSWGPSGTRVKTSDANWKKPLKWNSDGIRRRVFCASLADVFEDWQGPILNHKQQRLYNTHVPGGQWLVQEGSHDSRLGLPVTMDDLRSKLFQLIDATPNLDWLLLTKRPENILKMWPGWQADLSTIFTANATPKYRSNVWLGTSVENQKYADERIPLLMQCRDLSPVLFLSAEPLLGPVDLLVRGGNGEPLPPVDWVIAGGESGPESRSSDVEWFRSLRAQCKAAGIPFHFKQLSQADSKDFNVESSFPEDLRVRELPLQDAR